MQIVRKLETNETRGAVFEEICRKNRIIRWADRSYRMVRPFRRCIIALYMLKSAVTLGPVPSKTARILAAANFANEAHAVARVFGIVPMIEIARMHNHRRNLFRLSQTLVFLKSLSRLPRIWRIIGKISRKHSFMPACRIASVLAYYMRFEEILKTTQIEITLTASNYSPESVSLLAAAQKRSIPSVYINHAPVPLHSPYVPPVLSDFCLFHGEQTRKTYEQRSQISGRVILIGQEGQVSPLVWRDKPASVGIFLTALTRSETIETLVSEIKASHPDMNILIRHHPVSLLETDLTSLLKNYSDIKVTMGTPLDDDIAVCDLVFCGNSGVVQNTLRGGRPVAYFPELDQLSFDYNGFHKNGLVHRVSGWSAELYQSLHNFYETPAWKHAMRDYDASYDQPKEELEVVVRATLLALVADHQRNESHTSHSLLTAGKNDGKTSNHKWPECPASEQ